MTEQEIIWGDPPARRSTAVRVWDKVLEPLMTTEHKGKWGRVKTGSPSTMYSTAGNLRNGSIAIPGKVEDWEFAARKLDDDTAGLWVRYIGE